MDHCILLLKHLSNHMHFITNGYKRFSKTNSTDPRQRLMQISIKVEVQFCPLQNGIWVSLNANCMIFIYRNTSNFGISPRLHKLYLVIED